MSRIILIVDDTNTCSDTLELALSTMPDLDVRTVASAQEALHLADTLPIAALITDLHMPRIDGFELIRRIRSQPRFAGVCIFVISGDSDKTTPRRLLELGADAFFAKPFSPAAVRQALEQALYAK